MDFYGDYHIHSNYSDGRASIREMVEAAQIKGLKEMAISDHGPKNIGTGVKSSETYLQIKKEIRELAHDFPQLRLQVGAEADIIGLEGEIDICPAVVEKLDLLMVGLHPYVFPKDLSTAWHLVLGNQIIKVHKGQQEKIKNINTKTLIEAVHKHNCLAVTHPGLKMDIDLYELAKACNQNNTALEINTSHKFPGVKEVLAVAKTGVNFIVNSDAHFPESVGELDFGSYVLEKANIPPEQVLNAIH